MRDRNEGRLVWHLARAYPADTVLVVSLLLAAGVLEGLGFLTLLPVLEVALDGTGPASRLGRAAATLLARLGVEPTLGGLLALVVAALTAKGVFRWLAMRRVGRTVARVGEDLRRRLMRTLMMAPWDYFAGTRAGELSNLLGLEAFRAGMAYRQACAALAAVVQIATYVALALLVSWRTAVLALAAGVMLTALFKGLVRVGRRAGQERTERAGRLVERFADTLQAMKSIKALGRERHFLDGLEADAGSLRRSEEGQVSASEALHSFQEPALAAAVAAGVYFLLSGGGYATAELLLLVFLFHRVVGRFHALQSEYQGMVGAEAAVWALRDATRRAAAAPVPLPGGREAPAVRDAVVFDHVGFRRGDQVILEDVAFRVPAGELALVVGPSGAGKTTLADLLIGLVTPTSGRLLVDGVDLADVDPASWRRRVGYVPQQTLLLHDTVARNVALGRDTDPGELEAALRAAGAWEFVAALPNGVHSVVGERGGRLSGGERQRLALARALLDRPRLLVLDEATAGLDPVTERGILETLTALRGDVTVVAISHGSEFDRLADRVFDVRGGSVAERTGAVL